MKEYAEAVAAALTKDGIPAKAIAPETSLDDWTVEINSRFHVQVCSDGLLMLVEKLDDGRLLFGEPDHNPLLFIHLVKQKVS